MAAVLVLDGDKLLEHRCSEHALIFSMTVGDTRQRDCRALHLTTIREEIYNVTKNETEECGCNREDEGWLIYIGAKYKMVTDPAHSASVSPQNICPSPISQRLRGGQAHSCVYSPSAAPFAVSDTFDGLNASTFFHIMRTRHKATACRPRKLHFIIASRRLVSILFLFVFDVFVDTINGSRIT